MSGRCQSCRCLSFLLVGWLVGVSPHPIQKWTGFDREPGIGYRAGVMAKGKISDLARHSQETRDAARKLLEEGKTPGEVSQALSIPEGTIRGWVSREGWLTPLSVVGRNRLARELARATKAEAAEKWSSRWDAGREQVHGLILAALQGAALPPPKNWQELSIAVETLRKICGISDKAEASPGAVVQIGIAPVASGGAPIVQVSEG